MVVGGWIVAIKTLLEKVLLNPAALQRAAIPTAIMHGLGEFDECGKIAAMMKWPAGEMNGLGSAHV